MKLFILISTFVIIKGFIMIPLTLKHNYFNLLKSNNNDSALIPKKDIPKHTPIWPPVKYY